MQSHTILRLAWYPLLCGNCFAPSQIWFNEIGTTLHVFNGCRYQNMNRLTRWCQFPLFFFFLFLTVAFTVFLRCFYGRTRFRSPCRKSSQDFSAAVGVFLWCFCGCRCTQDIFTHTRHIYTHTHTCSYGVPMVFLRM